MGTAKITIYDLIRLYSNNNLTSVMPVFLLGKCEYKLSYIKKICLELEKLEVIAKEYKVVGGRAWFFGYYPVDKNRIEI